jgi:putative ABC transport system permease protein
MNNTLKTSFRYLIRNKGLTLINILGLAIGICIFILIMHYVRNELSYDKFLSKQETVGRLEFVLPQRSASAWTTSSMGYDVREAIPEITGFVRFKTWDELYVEYEEINYRIPAVSLVDSNVFDLFDLEMLHGDPASALREPFTAVLVKSLADKIFDEEDPLDKIIKTPGGRDIRVTGVIDDPPNFHRYFDMLLSFVSLGVLYGEEHLYTYRTYQYDTYFEMIAKADPDTVDRKLTEFFYKKYEELDGEPVAEEDAFKAMLRPVKDIYFARNVRDSGTRHGNKQFVVIFIIIAVFIILIACVNFINLSTARAAGRAMEVGIRKVVGSGRRKLIFQFLTESLMISFLATLIGLLLVESVFPEFENILGADLRIAYLENPLNLLIILSGVIAIGVIAGLYPAFYLTAFQPVSVLKGEKTRGKSGSIMRKILIIFQFTISIILIIGTIIVYRQLNYLGNKDLGFKKEFIVTIPLNNEVKEKMEVFKENLLAHPQVETVSYSYTTPGAGDNWETFSLEGVGVSSVVYTIDPDYLPLTGIELEEGRNFSWDLETDKGNTCLINETLAKELEKDSLVGKWFDHPSWYITAFPVERFQIIGIMKDFHFKSLRQPIGNLIFGWGDQWINFANVRTSPDNIGEALQHIEREWKNLSPQYPFEYAFMDENFDRMYRADQKLAKIFRYFAALAIFIAILGLFGLAAFIAEKRTREIGIRKAMGATISSVSILLVREFTWLILLASVIAWAVAWFWARNWLQEFAYRMDITIWIFIISTLMALIIAWITVISQTLKAANTNPADSLRYE